MDIGREDVFVLNMIIFSVVAVVHFFRLVLATEATVGGYAVPLWLSGLALIVLVFLLWQNWRFTDRDRVTCAKIVAGIFLVDLVGVLAFWAKGIEFIGFSGTDYLLIAVFDAAIIAVLTWYILKN